MPTSVWTCEISWDTFVYTSPPGGVGPTYRQEWRAGFEVIALPLLDAPPALNAPTDEGNWCLSLAIIEDGSAVQTVHQRGGNVNDIVFQWSTPVAVAPSPFLTGAAAALTAGGTLTITKDYDAGTVTFVGPLGTQSIDLTQPAFATMYNPTPLRPRGVVERVTIPDPTALFPALTIDDKIRWYDMIGKENGVPYLTAPLSAAAPGTWWPVYYTAFDPLVGTSIGISFPWTWTQLTAREEIRAQVSTIPGMFGFAEYAFGYRVFDTWRRLMLAVDSALDMTAAREHGPLFAALVYSTAPGVVRFRRTYDTGTSWTETDLYSNPATSNASPTMLWQKGRLYGVWQRDSAIVQSVSPDLGVSWGTPVTLAISGTNPRALVDPRHGLSFYFFIDAGDLKLRRSANFGTDWIDASPITVATSVGAQTVAAEIAADGSLLVSYIASGAWTQVRSKDLGVSWA